jgi:hypothetical protein
MEIHISESKSNQWLNEYLGQYSVPIEFIKRILEVAKTNNGQYNKIIEERKKIIEESPLASDVKEVCKFGISLCSKGFKLLELPVFPISEVTNFIYFPNCFFFQNQELLENASILSLDFRDIDQDISFGSVISMVNYVMYYLKNPTLDTPQGMLLSKHEDYLDLFHYKLNTSATLLKWIQSLYNNVESRKSTSITEEITKAPKPADKSKPATADSSSRKSKSDNKRKSEDASSKRKDVQSSKSDKTADKSSDKSSTADTPSSSKKKPEDVASKKQKKDSSSSSSSSDSSSSDDEESTLKKKKSNKSDSKKKPEESQQSSKSDKTSIEKTLGIQSQSLAKAASKSPVKKPTKKTPPANSSSKSLSDGKKKPDSADKSSTTPVKRKIQDDEEITTATPLSKKQKASVFSPRLIPSKPGNPQPLSKLTPTKPFSFADDKPAFVNGALSNKLSGLAMNAVDEAATYFWERNSQNFFELFKGATDMLQVVPFENMKKLLSDSPIIQHHLNDFPQLEKLKSSISPQKYHMVINSLGNSVSFASSPDEFKMSIMDEEKDSGTSTMAVEMPTPLSIELE